MKTHHGRGLGSVQATVPQQRKPGTAIVGKAGFEPTRSSDSDWRHRAACRDEDPELFYPVSENGPGALQVEDAKAVCFRCSAQGECLAWALGNGQDFGVWGAMSAEERRSLKRREARARSRMA